jgi:hypothetical protein
MQVARSTALHCMPDVLKANRLSIIMTSNKRLELEGAQMEW